MSVWRQITLVFITLILGCSTHDELPPPDNPFDPGNPDYVSPTVDIIGGPSESEIVGVTTVTFEWQGNESATEYSYQFDGSGWSEWSESTAAEFDYLDEGDHLFKVQARSVNGDAQETPTALGFGVDAVGGPSALVYPYKYSANPGDTLIYQIVAEEVTELFAVECHIEVDDNLELIDVIDGNLQSGWGGNALMIQEITGQTFSLSIVSVEGTTTSYSGTASILNIITRITPTAEIGTEIAAVQISLLHFLNPSLNKIDIELIRAGVLDVK
jgi:hypothetical protein